MQFEVIAPIVTETHLKISKVVDGDSIKVASIFNKDEKEIRLYGIDAPEISKCAKLKQDEAETHMAGELLIKLGRLSLEYILTIAPPMTKCTLIQEQDNTTDFYGRSLGYLILPDGSCLNEIMITEGFAKPYSKYYCTELTKYQSLNVLAKTAQKGLYQIVQNF